MRKIDYAAARRRTRRILLATGAGLMLAFPAASAQAAPKTDQGSQGTCPQANTNGAANSNGSASGAATTSCPPGHDGSAGGVTGHKVG